MRIYWRVAPARGGRAEAGTVYAPFAVLTAVLAASVLVPPVREAWGVPCPVHLLLGIAGPGCGMTRAFLFIGHGDLASAFALNPNSWLVFPLTVALWANYAARILCGRQVELRLSQRAKTGVYGLAAALTAAVWVYNLTVNPWV